MEKHKSTYEVYANVTFTPDEVKNMTTCSAEHYDTVCRNASQHGGFLHGMTNRMESGPGPHRLSSRQVDTLCKILESYSADKSLYWNMRRLLLDMKREYEAVNGTDNDTDDISRDLSQPG